MYSATDRSATAHTGPSTQNDTNVDRQSLFRKYLEAQLGKMKDEGLSRGISVYSQALKDLDEKDRPVKNEDDDWYTRYEQFVPEDVQWNK